MEQNSEIKITQESYNSPAAVKTYDREELKWTENKIFSDYFKIPGKVLDLGCGTGRTSYFLKQAGHEVIAIDYSESMIKRAREKYGNLGIKFLIMSADCLDFEDNTFDYALFSFNGLDYLYPETARHKALQEIYRVLKPGGIFAFSSHNSLFIPNTPGRILNFLRTLFSFKIMPYRWDFQKFGKVITHFISPMAQIKELKKVGFHDVLILSKYGKFFPAIMIRDPYPTYICKK